MANLLTVTIDLDDGCYFHGAGTITFSLGTNSVDFVTNNNSYTNTLSKTINASWPPGTYSMVCQLLMGLDNSNRGTITLNSAPPGNFQNNVAPITPTGAQFNLGHSTTIYNIVANLAPNCEGGWGLTKQDVKLSICNTTQTQQGYGTQNIAYTYPNGVCSTFVPQSSFAEVTCNVAPFSGTLKLVFNDISNASYEYKFSLKVAPNDPALVFWSENIKITLACIHGSSLVQTNKGLIRIDKLKAGDLVLSGDNLDEFVPIKSVRLCPLKVHYSGEDHGCIMVNDLIVDPGHRIAYKEDYIKYGLQALKPAAEYNNGYKLYKNLEDKTGRYDLELPDNYHVYVANNIIIKSFCGDDHRYNELV